MDHSTFVNAPALWNPENIKTILDTARTLGWAAPVGVFILLALVLFFFGWFCSGILEPMGGWQDPSADDDFKAVELLKARAEKAEGLYAEFKEKYETVLRAAKEAGLHQSELKLGIDRIRDERIRAADEMKKEVEAKLKRTEKQQALEKKMLQHASRQLGKKSAAVNSGRLLELEKISVSAAAHLDKIEKTGRFQKAISDNILSDFNNAAKNNVVGRASFPSSGFSRAAHPDEHLCENCFARFTSVELLGEHHKENHA